MYCHGTESESNRIESNRIESNLCPFLDGLATRDGTGMEWAGLCLIHYHHRPCCNASHPAINKRTPAPHLISSVPLHLPILRFSIAIRAVFLTALCALFVAAPTALGRGARLVGPGLGTCLQLRPFLSPNSLYYLEWLL